MRKRYFLFMFSGLLILGFCCFFLSRSNGLQLDNGLFSWQAHVLVGEERQELFKHMKEWGLHDLYQSIPVQTEPSQVQEFLREAAEHGVAVYLLTGDPSWGLDESGTAMLEEITRVAKYNEGVEPNQQLRGMILDVEPYLTEEWQLDADAVMASYVTAMEKAKDAAADNSLTLLACIPYFYDTIGQEEGLIQLVKKGCDGLAVMNYHKKREAEHLATELALAEEYGKPLVTIYELQPPGKHDLTEYNTYYQDGWDGVMQSWQSLQQQISYDRFSFAIHHYMALQEVMGVE